MPFLTSRSLKFENDEVPLRLRLVVELLLEPPLWFVRVPLFTTPELPLFFGGVVVAPRKPPKLLPRFAEVPPFTDEPLFGMSRLKTPEPLTVPRAG